MLLQTGSDHDAKTMPSDWGVTKFFSAGRLCTSSTKDKHGNHNLEPKQFAVL
jgi:hypothetical protein